MWRVRKPRMWQSPRRWIEPINGHSACTSRCECRCVGGWGGGIDRCVRSACRRGRALLSLLLRRGRTFPLPLPCVCVCIPGAQVRKCACACWFICTLQLELELTAQWVGEQYSFIPSSWQTCSRARALESLTFSCKSTSSILHECAGGQKAGERVCCCRRMWHLHCNTEGSPRKSGGPTLP